MDKTIRVTVTQQDDGRYAAKSTQPNVLAVADTAEEALEHFQEELTFALESSYPGEFGGNFRARDMMVTLDIVVEGVKP